MDRSQICCLQSQTFYNDVMSCLYLTHLSLKWSLFRMLLHFSALVAVFNMVVDLTYLIVTKCGQGTCCIEGRLICSDGTVHCGSIQDVLTKATTATSAATLATKQ